MRISQHTIGHVKARMLTLYHLHMTKTVISYYAVSRVKLCIRSKEASLESKSKSSLIPYSLIIQKILVYQQILITIPQNSQNLYIASGLSATKTSQLLALRQTILLGKRRRKKSLLRKKRLKLQDHLMQVVLCISIMKHPQTRENCLFYVKSF